MQPRPVISTLQKIILPVLLLGCLGAAAYTNELMVYRMSWMGTTIGEMTLSSSVTTNGGTLRSMRVRSRSWARLFSNLDDTVTCESDGEGADLRRVVRKRISEDGFVQDDQLVLWPNRGQAIFDAGDGGCTTSSVPVGLEDMVTFFYDLRDLAPARTNGTSLAGERHLVMDGVAHKIALTTGPVVRVEVPWGKADALSVEAQSHSDGLFVRNVPRDIRIGLSPPVLLSMDVEHGGHTVHVRLRDWLRDGEPVPSE